MRAAVAVLVTVMALSASSADADSTALYWTCRDILATKPAVAKSGSDEVKALLRQTEQSCADPNQSSDPAALRVLDALGGRIRSGLRQ